MKVLIIHNEYQHRGGEDTVVAAESALLRDAGHQVHVELVSNRKIQGLSGKIRTFVRTPHDAARKTWMNHLLDAANYDVVHVHNFFPLLTPAIHEAAAERGVAVVQTLHNYRLLCAGALFLRDGHVCEKCLDGAKLWGAAHRCYRGSALGSLAVVRLQQRAHRHQTWHRQVHRFIALTEFAKGKFVAGGLPAERISVKPNFAGPLINPMQDRQGVVFVGRLSPEKGVRTLVESWARLPHIPLTIIGDGPAREALEQMAPSNVAFRGALPADQVRMAMATAQALVMPSVWYEGFPMTLVEAFSVGTPVIASRIGSLAELIRDGITGRTFEPGNIEDLAQVVQAAFARPDLLPGMGSAAHAEYQQLYTPGTNLARLEGIYREAISEVASAAAS